MNNLDERNHRKWKFSLRHLLTLTALAALFIAVAIAYRKNESLNQSRAALLSLSSRLDVTDEDKLTHVALPKVANDFQTWDVHVPPGPALELRLGIGDVSEAGIPSQVERVGLPAGRHRVTLHSVVSPDSGNRFVVYVDAKQVIEKVPARDWLPGGWSSSSGLSWPQGPTTNEQTPLQLAGQRYTLRPDIGKNNYFNGSDDSLVTSPGYRVWIDQPDRSYEPASPFLGFEHHTTYHGIGLRDGLRYKMSTTAPYELTLTRPKSRGRDPVLRIIPEFIVDGKSVLSSQTPSFSSWQLRNDAVGKDALRWTKESSQTVYNAFLHATFKSDEDVKPVIELKWDADKPSEVGLRLAQTPANERITRLRLRIVGGTKHLWRKIDAGKQKLDSKKESDEKPADSSGMTISLDPVGEGDGDIQINWQTDQSLPLQVVQRNRVKPNPYSGVSLYQGLPLKFAARIPKSLAPSISVTRINQHPTLPDTPFPGGAVFGEIQMELKAEQDDWIWLQAQDLKITP
ncbi:hypothetical protein CA13_61540 [Planctomycetes bacterium CA13]|uniref:Uncharacterized protein n=1 Tax=Novipirellula herctigrandis TaxID=2527986 RepID=A0A5C5ZBI8_9BACT|nr:hypothetical protein CA13_61540 [Planctomycetes bacterium CA13]